MDGRSLDAGGPLLVSWSERPSDEDEGLWVEARFETLDIEQRTVVLEVRTVERDDDDGALFATSDPARVICRLETGACTADDDAARVLLADHPEVEARLQSHMDHVRQRAWRAVAQRDRETAAARRVLANAEPGLMVAFQDLFPADRESMHWELHSGLDDAHPLREHIESLLVVLGTRERSLRARWVDYDLILQCVGYHPPMSHGAHFDRELVRKTANLGLAIDLDFYFVAEREDGAVVGSSAIDRHRERQPRSSRNGGTLRA